MSRHNWMVHWTALDKLLWWLGICRSDVWANLLFVKGNSTEGGGTGSRRKNAANVELAWHFYAGCEPWVASASTGDSDDGETQIATEKVQRVTCKPDFVEDTFTRQRGLISVIYLLLTFVLADTFLSYSLAKHGKGKQRAIFPSHPVRLEGSNSKNSH